MTYAKLEEAFKCDIYISEVANATHLTTQQIHPTTNHTMDKSVNSQKDELATTI